MMILNLQTTIRPDCGSKNIISTQVTPMTNGVPENAVWLCTEASAPLLVTADGAGHDTTKLFPVGEISVMSLGQLMSVGGPTEFKKWKKKAANIT